VTTAIEGTGTDEARWQQWLLARACPPLDAELMPGRRVVVLAAHPDDEVLGVGGLLAAARAAGGEVVALWASDGEASHPGSAAISRARLAALRREESRRALARLGVEPLEVLHLGLPDGAVADHADRLREAVANLVRDDDVVVAPWRDDAHPDHEAVGRVAAEVAATLLEYPIWMWHWAVPDDPRVPWSRLRAVAVPDVAAKAAAIDAFDTQVRPIGPKPADAAVLPPHVVAHFRRPFEVVFQ
jgi:LmbE family N-acetylglucosaminyl deacetylase